MMKKMSNWRETIRKNPMDYDTGEFKPTDSPFSGDGGSVRQDSARRQKELDAGRMRDLDKKLQQLVMQQVETKLPGMAESGQTRIRIPREKLEGLGIDINESGADTVMRRLKKLLGRGMRLGVDGRDIIVDAGRGEMATRDGKTLNPETGEPMGRMEEMGQRMKDRFGQTRFGQALGRRTFGKGEEHLELVNDAILKAKTVLQEAQHLGTIEMKEPVMGEEVSMQRPKKNPAEEKFDNPQIDGYGHVGSSNYIGKALTERYTGIKEQLAVVDDQIAKAYVDGATSSRQELINKRIRIENSLDDVSRTILTDTVLKSMYVLETIVKSTSTHTPVFVDTITKTMAQLEALMDEFNAGEIDRDEYEKKYKKIKGSLHEEASSPGGHDSGDGKPRVKKSDSELVRKNLRMLDELMERFKAGEITAEEMEAEYQSNIRDSLMEEAPTGHDSVEGIGDHEG